MRATVYSSSLTYTSCSTEASTTGIQSAATDRTPAGGQPPRGSSVAGILTTYPGPPTWAADAVIYQIFPDRFARSGRVTAQDPEWVRRADWDDPIRWGQDGALQQIYGGDLWGVAERLDHLADLGANLIYRTPFLPARSNHRYDATTFAHVDPLLGGDEALAALSEAARGRGMRVIGTVPKELDESAQIDGATHAQVFFRVLLPLVAPILVVVALFSFVATMNDFVIAGLVLTEPGQQTLGVGLYQLVSYQLGQNWGLFAAGALIGALPVVVLFQFLQRFIVGGLTSGAVKG